MIFDLYAIAVGSVLLNVGQLVHRYLHRDDRRTPPPTATAPLSIDGRRVAQGLFSSDGDLVAVIDSDDWAVRTPRSWASRNGWDLLGWEVTGDVAADGPQVNACQLLVQPAPVGFVRTLPASLQPHRATS